MKTIDHATLPENRNAVQALFNLSASHILQQGKPAVEFDSYGNAACQYSTASGLHCAAWPFLTPDAPGYLMGAWGRIASSERSNKYIKDEAIAYPDFITQLQTAHDSAAELKGFPFLPIYRRNMREVAKLYNLDASLVPALPEDEAHIERFETYNKHRRAKHAADMIEFGEA